MNKRVVYFLLGTALLIGALPAGGAIVLGVGGCCGAPSNPFSSLGYVLMTVMIIAGLTLSIKAVRMKGDK